MLIFKSEDKKRMTIKDITYGHFFMIERTELNKNRNYEDLFQHVFMKLDDGSYKDDINHRYRIASIEDGILYCIADDVEVKPVQASINIEVYKNEN